MSRHDPAVTLRHLLEYAERAQHLCMENSLTEIQCDWRKQATFERVMEVIGEAVKRLPPELLANYPAVDWRGIAGMRDRISHGYDAIDYTILWQAVETRVPGLIETIKQMLNHIGADPN
jgi:uncharacterized protein with HEPN domain